MSTPPEERPADASTRVNGGDAPAPPEAAKAACADSSASAAPAQAWRKPSELRNISRRIDIVTPCGGRDGSAPFMVVVRYVAGAGNITAAAGSRPGVLRPSCDN